MAKKESQVLDLAGAISKINDNWLLTPSQKTLFKEVLSALVAGKPTKATRIKPFGIILRGRPFKDYKIGTRVVVIAAVDGKDEWINDVGVIAAKRTEGDRLNIGVDFKEHKEGRHNLEGRIKTPTGWWSEHSSLGILEPKPTKGV